MYSPAKQTRHIWKSLSYRYIKNITNRAANENNVRKISKFLVTDTNPVRIAFTPRFNLFMSANMVRHLLEQYSSFGSIRV